MSFLPNAVTSRVSMLLLRTRKHSPTILFAGGVVGVIGTVVLASRATLQLEEVLEEHNRQLDDIREVEANPAIPNYTADKAKQDRVVLYVQSSVTIVKLYGPAVLLGAASIGMLAGSHHILNRRNAAITAAYAALDKGFREYRERVSKELGEDKERQIRHGLEKKTIEVTDEKGKKSKKEIVVSHGPSEYARLFHEQNNNWQRNPEYNMVFLQLQQSFLNDRMRANGFVLLNDAYDALGFERTKAGCVVGWIRDNEDGDGFVDFGLFDDFQQHKVFDYMIGVEREILVDFNVDGIIYDKI